MICLRSTTVIRCGGVEYHVIEAPEIPVAPVTKTTRKRKVA